MQLKIKIQNCCLRTYFIDIKENDIEQDKLVNFDFSTCK